ncbi:PDZ domain-containing protein, partial [Acinetobacter nosocomialis]|uniref:PDZ domain-containing protein n=1 Tax=Acinetobacter nosocomialis TaxID=106654 RepID=UPI003AF8C975
RVVRGWLGISLLPPTHDEVLAPNPPVGVIVADVLKIGPAASAGIKVGDKIVQVIIEPITSASHLIYYVALQARFSLFNLLGAR